MRKITKQITLNKSLPYILIATGIIGCVASFVLTYDKIQVLKNPGYEPMCNISPIFSCGSVMKTEQASLLGVPNTIFGLIGFTSLASLGFLLSMGAQLKRRLWITVEIITATGLIFMHYLFFQAVYRIGAICPWCFVVWMITIPTFWYITLYNLREGHIKPPYRLRKLNDFLQANHGSILVFWYMIILGILMHRFWYYWSSLI